MDFDHTILDVNSDVEILDLLDGDPIPDRIQAINSSSGWTAYMGALFELLFSKVYTYYYSIFNRERFLITRVDYCCILLFTKGSLRLFRVRQKPITRGA